MVELLKNAQHAVAFTGAGISLESGIPTFRGENGLWSKYDPKFLELDYFYRNPQEAWRLNIEVFYQHLARTKPNPAHRILAGLEKKGLIKAVITQNIDNLHQQAGSNNVIEFHGSSNRLFCIECNQQVEFKWEYLDSLPPTCQNCQGILKPGYIFFGEPIPEPARTLAFQAAETADLFLVIGTTGEVQPASFLPVIASRNGALIIEINPAKSNYYLDITDIYLPGGATHFMTKIEAGLAGQ
ncbi:MAG: NAD-dependent deacylase [Halanaerobiales bacterium]|nr:NAD-dependent deacylase [Halanaerobiales bacterium]